MIRIERRRPRSLLRELPDGWAQTCITGPPECWQLAGFRAVIDELHRVIRRDGTLLWNVDRDQPLPLRRLVFEFRICGWRLQPSPLAVSSGYLLFAKQPPFHWQPPARPSAPRRTRPGSTPNTRSVWWERRPWCIPCPTGDSSAWRERQLERLLLTATAPVACGACGAPWRQQERQQRRHATGKAMGCGHRNPHGRCLVIDPYHLHGSPLPAIAARNGRSYLGVQAPAPTAAWEQQ